MVSQSPCRQRSTLSDEKLTPEKAALILRLFIRFIFFCAEHSVVFNAAEMGSNRGRRHILSVFRVIVNRSFN